MTNLWKLLDYWMDLNSLVRSTSVNRSRILSTKIVCRRRVAARKVSRRSTEMSVPPLRVEGGWKAARDDLAWRLEGWKQMVLAR